MRTLLALLLLSSGLPAFQAASLDGLYQSNRWFAIKQEYRAARLEADNVAPVIWACC